MSKRGRLEIMRDILDIVHRNNNRIRPTPLLRKSGLSSSSFTEYYSILISKHLVIEKEENNEKNIVLSEKGLNFLNKYRTILEFIEEFDL